MAALAVVRALGRRGLTVWTAREEGKRELAGHSRYAAGRIVLPPAPEYWPKLRETAAELAAEAVLPCADGSLRAYLQAAETSPPGFFAPARAALGVFMNKAETFRQAERRGFRIPRTTTFFSPGSAAEEKTCSPSLQEGIEGKEVAAFPAEFLESWPVVLKPAVSLGPDGRRREAEFAFSPEDLRTRLDKAARSGGDWLIQEWIAGPGVGVEVVADRGRILAAGAHRRLREEDPRGARSAAAQTIPVPPKELAKIEAWLAELEWSGPAMFEYKHAPDGDLCLLEVNPRFWGTLPLAQAAGEDFPWAAYLAATKQVDAAASAPDEAWRTGLRGGYLRAEWRWAKAALKGRPEGWPGVWPSRFEAVWGLASTLITQPHRFVWAWDDPWPALRDW